MNQGVARGYSLVFSRRGVVAFFFGFGVALSPVYLGESGGFQLAHIFLLAALVFGLRRIFPLTRIDVLLGCYLAYACVREGLAIIGGAAITTLLPVAQLAFGFCVFLLARASFSDAPALRPLVKWCFVGTAVAVVGVLVLGSSGLEAEGAARAIGTFNNPNQLGYFGVLMGSIAILLSQRGVLSQKQAFLLILACTYLCVVSLSKSAMGSAVIIVLAYFAQSFSRRTLQFGFVVLVVLISLNIALEMGWLRFPALEDFAAYRRIIGAAKENDTSFAVRGYSILDNASWSDVIFGLSSAGVAALRGGYEVHSTYMAPIGAYGLVGGGLFILFLLYLSVSTIGRFGMLGFFGVLLPTLLYGVAHNGGRTALFWCLAGLVAAQGSRLPERSTRLRRAGRIA